MDLLASTVVTPGGLLEPGRVAVGDDGLISSVGAAPAGARVPDRVLCPGFVDIQVNGTGDVDCATAERDDWVRLGELLRSTGVTTWCPTLVTSPLDAYARPLAAIAEEMDRQRFLTGVPRIAGAHLEGPFLGGAAGAHRPDLIVPVDLDWLTRLPLGGSVKVITLAPESPGALEAIAVLRSAGVVVAIGHSTASFELAVAAAEAGATVVTHLFNAMSPLHHRAPGLAGAALADPRLHPSLIADGVHVHPAALGVAARAKGPGGWLLVTDAVAAANERSTARGVTVEEGAPRLPDGTIAGSVLTMNEAIGRMVEQAAVPLAEAVAAASSTPARLLGLRDRGRIAPGCAGHLVAMASDFSVEDVWIP